MSDERVPSPGQEAGSSDVPRDSAAAPPTVSNWNLPNALTTLRIVLVPLFGWLLLVDDGQDTTYRCWAFVVFVLAILTDKIDGELARSRNLVTEFGKLMDPIADKALTGMAFVGLSIIGELWWWVTILVLVREWGITLMRFWLIRRGVVMPAGQGGKLKTVVQTVALAMLIAPLRLFDGPWDGVGEGLWWIAIALMAVAVALTLWSGLVYVRDTRASVREQTAKA